MELKHLRTFLEAAARSSFTAAGDKLGITQAAVSQHVAALEHELDVELFERSHRTITLTEAGTRLVQHATQIVDLVSQTPAVVQCSANQVQGHIRIAASTVPAESLLPSLLGVFREAFPAVRESIFVSDSQTATKAVASGDADVGFVGEKSAQSQLQFHPVAKDELLLVVSPSHVWAKKQFITPASLSQQPLILREVGSGSRHCVEAALRAKGVDLDALNVGMEMNSNDAIRAAIKQNAGAAFLSSTTVANDLELGNLKQVRIKGIKPSRELHIVTKPNASTSRAVTEFVKFAMARQ